MEEKLNPASIDPTPRLTIQRVAGGFIVSANGFDRAICPDRPVKLARIVREWCEEILPPKQPKATSPSLPLPTE